MSRLPVYVSIALLLCTFSSCDPCDNLDCASNVDYLQLRIVNAGGTDLLFGSNRRYNPDSIRFYSLTGADTLFHNSQTFPLSGTGYDSILIARFGITTQTAYMRLTNGDVDTLQLSYSSYDTKCCGKITSISTFKINNSADLSGTGTQVIIK